MFSLVSKIPTILKVIPSEKLESTLKESKLEIARNMKSLGLDIEVISKTTSLSVEEISKL